MVRKKQKLNLLQDDEVDGSLGDLVIVKSDFDHLLSSG